MPHRRESTPFRRGTRRNTCIRLQRGKGRDPEVELELAVGRPRTGSTLDMLKLSHRRPKRL